MSPKSCVMGNQTTTLGRLNASQPETQNSLHMIWDSFSTAENQSFTSNVCSYKCSQNKCLALVEIQHNHNENTGHSLSAINHQKRFQDTLFDIHGHTSFRGIFLRPLSQCHISYTILDTDFQLLGILFYILFHSFNSRTYTSTTTARYRGSIAARSREDGLSRHQIYTVDKGLIINVLF